MHGLPDDVECQSGVEGEVDPRGVLSHIDGEVEVVALHGHVLADLGSLEAFGPAEVAAVGTPIDEEVVDVEGVHSATTVGGDVADVDVEAVAAGKVEHQGKDHSVRPGAAKQSLGVTQVHEGVVPGAPVADAAFDDDEVVAGATGDAIEARATEEPVVAVAADDVVVAVAAVGDVAAGATVERVRTGATVELVMTVATDEGVTSLVALEPVIAGIAEEGVVAETAVAGVVAETGRDQVMATEAVDPGVEVEEDAAVEDGGVDDIGTIGAGKGHEHRKLGRGVFVVERGHGHGVSASLALSKTLADGMSAGLHC